MIDIRKGNVVSDQPVELEFLQGVLNAKQLEIVDSGDLIRFHGGVDMVMKLTSSDLPKTGAPSAEVPKAEAPKKALPKKESPKKESSKKELSKPAAAKQ
jgi:lipopolysaccharide export system protein LptC